MVISLALSRCLADPGYVTAQMLERMDDDAHDALEQDGGKQQHVALDRLPACRRCRQPKPFRAHHCSLCNKCVLKMGACSFMVRSTRW